MWHPLRFTCYITASTITTRLFQKLVGFESWRLIKPCSLFEVRSVAFPTNELRMVRGLHIEIATGIMLGDLLQDSGCIEWLFLCWRHLIGTRHAHQKTALLSDRYLEHGMRTLLYRERLGMKVLSFVRSLKARNFLLYFEVMELVHSARKTPKELCSRKTCV